MCHHGNLYVYAVSTRTQCPFYKDIYIKPVLFGLDQVNCQYYIEVIRKKVFYCTIRSG